MSEYELLRSEMMDNQKTITQYELTLYTAVSALIAFALGKQEYYYCLIPYVAIIPLYLLAEAKRQSICDIAAYLSVFCEGETINWEKRHQKIEAQTRAKRNWRSTFLYYFIAVVCSGTAIFKLFISGYAPLAMWIRVAILLVFTIIVLAFLKANTINYVELRKKRIKQWTKLKEQEE